MVTKYCFMWKVFNASVYLSVHQSFTSCPFVHRSHSSSHSFVHLSTPSSPPSTVHLSNHLHHPAVHPSIDPSILLSMKPSIHSSLQSIPSRSSHWAWSSGRLRWRIFPSLPTKTWLSVPVDPLHARQKTKYHNPVNDAETLNNAPSTAAINFQIRAVVRALSWNDVRPGRPPLFTLE